MQDVLHTLSVTRIVETALGVALGLIVLAVAGGVLSGALYAIVWLLGKAQEATAHQQSFKREPRSGHES
jgi:hypothetical protein